MTFNKVVLSWEAAYGTAYQIQVSSDNSTWSTVYTRSGGSGGLETLNFASTTARYVRMYGTARATQWGYSLWAFEVYDTGTVISPTITASAGAGGSISPSGSVSVASGASRSFTITPATGYSIASVLVDGPTWAPSAPTPSATSLRPTPSRPASPPQAERPRESPALPT